MEYINLQHSDLKVSPVSLGSWQFNAGIQTKNQVWGEQDEEVSRQIVDKAIELGINFFDTAEGYPESEAVLGRSLDGRRKSVVVATKFGGRLDQYSPTDIDVSVTNSLRNLKTDYLDLYQVHWPCFISNDVKGCVEELNRQKAKGRIRYYGVSNFGPKNLEEFIGYGGSPITNQMAYNLLWRGIEEEIVPSCQKHGIGILAYSPIMQGLLTGKFRKPEDVPENRRGNKFFRTSSSPICYHKGAGVETLLFQTIEKIRGICDKENIAMTSAALSWCLQQPQVDCVIVGASNPQQMEQNVQLVQLRQEVLKELDSITGELKSTFGNNADLWVEGSRIS